jgi:dGTPase
VASALLRLHPDLADSHVSELGAIVSAACLAHDMGNPPFGHSGERAISTYFSEGEGLRLRPLLSAAEWEDLTHFEGNANAFRLLTHQFEGRRRGGFVMTYSTLASIVKYPFSSRLAGGKSKFGFFLSEEADYVKIARELGIRRLSAEGEPLRYARHPLVYLVEAADDICYMMMDIEDAYKLKLLNTAETKEAFSLFLNERQRARSQEVYALVTDVNEQIAYLRSSVIGILVRECTATFVAHEQEILDGTFRGTLIEQIEEPYRRAYEACAALSMKRIYRSRPVVDVELAGFRVISTLISLMIAAVQEPEKAYSKLLIDRVSSQYSIRGGSLYDRILAVLDYISGMTDVYALDLYRKINGESLPAV